VLYAFKITGMSKGKAVKQINKSKYKGVSEYATTRENTVWLGQLGLKKKMFDTEREAALFVDKKLIEKGKEPVNILVRK
jgi:hypothetical protein